MTEPFQPDQDPTGQGSLAAERGPGSPSSAAEEEPDVLPDADTEAPAAAGTDDREATDWPVLATGDTAFRSLTPGTG